MEASWPTGAARVPHGLSPQRLWRWCVLRTLRDGRLAAQRNRPISRPNLERLFCRRWAAGVKVGPPPVYRESCDQWKTVGRSVVRQKFPNLLKQR